MSSKRWECRVAAAESVGLMAEHFVQHTVYHLQSISVPKDRCETLVSASSELASLNLEEMLASGGTLACGKQVSISDLLADSMDCCCFS